MGTGDFLKAHVAILAQLVSKGFTEKRPLNSGAMQRHGRLEISFPIFTIFLNLE